MMTESDLMRDTEDIRTEILKKVEKFRSMPALVTDILEVINNPNSDTKEIADRMRLDPGITANVLRLANSAYFGSPRTVSSVNEAVVRLGARRLFELIVATGIGPELNQPLPGYGLLPSQLLQHAVWVAVASEELCAKLDISMPDMTFTAGILHDVGKLVISDVLKDYQLAVEQYIEEQNISFEAAETEILGISHADVGAEILSRWNFPDELIQTVRYHHNPSKAGRSRQTADIVHLADSLAYTQGIGAGIDGLLYVVSDESAANLKLDSKTLEYVASVALEKVMELQELICARPGN